jgi:hypothetical protein
MIYTDLQGESFILWSRATALETFDDVIPACRAAGLSPQVVQEVTSAYTILGLVAAVSSSSAWPRSFTSRSTHSTRPARLWCR